MPCARRRFQRGLTLVETIVVCFVFSLLTLVITQLLIGGLGCWKKGNAQTTMRTNTRMILDAIAVDFRDAYGPGRTISANCSGLPIATSWTPNMVLMFNRAEPGVSATSALPVGGGTVTPNPSYEVNMTIYYIMYGATGESHANTLVRAEVQGTTVIGYTTLGNSIVYNPGNISNFSSYFSNPATTNAVLQSGFSTLSSVGSTLLTVLVTAQASILPTPSAGMKGGAVMSMESTVTAVADYEGNVSPAPAAVYINGLQTPASLQRPGSCAFRLWRLSETPTPHRRAACFHASQSMS